MYELVTACDPDDPSNCLDFECNEDGECCLVDVGCFDCSGADPDNFNPDDCDLDELYR